MMKPAEVADEQATLNRGIVASNPPTTATAAKTAKTKMATPPNTVAAAGSKQDEVECDTQVHHMPHHTCPDYRIVLGSNWTSPHRTQ